MNVAFHKTRVRDIEKCYHIYIEGLRTGHASFQEPTITLSDFRKGLFTEQSCVANIRKICPNSFHDIALENFFGFFSIEKDMPH